MTMAVFVSLCFRVKRGLGVGWACGEVTLRATIIGRGFFSPTSDEVVKGKSSKGPFTSFRIEKKHTRAIVYWLSLRRTPSLFPHALPSPLARIIVGSSRTHRASAEGDDGRSNTLGCEERERDCILFSGKNCR